jgi:peroxiredoxin
MTATLAGAGAYHLIWAAALVVAPAAVFVWLGFPIPGQVELVRALGLWTGVLGIGFLAAAGRPLRHWPVVLMGLLGKLACFGVIVSMVWQGVYDVGTLRVALLDGVAWLPPLGWILAAAREDALFGRLEPVPEVQRLSLRAQTNAGVSLEELSRLGPVLLVFLRHLGCPFCREALADVARLRETLSESGVRLVFVHMGGEAYAARLLARHGLAGALRIHDRGRTLYRAFGLRRGGLGEVLGPSIWWRALRAGVLEGHGFGRKRGDGFQLGGAFLLHQGEVVRSFRNATAATRPDYLALASGLG